jgi:hypothetical protein
VSWTAQRDCQALSDFARRLTLRFYGTAALSVVLRVFLRHRSDDGFVRSQALSGLRFQLVETFTLEQIARSTSMDKRISSEARRPKREYIEVCLTGRNQCA